MMNEWWLTETAAAFWEMAGPEYSSNFAMAVVFTLPLSTEWLPELTLYKAIDWLDEHRIPQR